MFAEHAKAFAPGAREWAMWAIGQAVQRGRRAMWHPGGGSSAKQVSSLTVCSATVRQSRLVIPRHLASWCRWPMQSRGCRASNGQFLHGLRCRIVGLSASTPRTIQRCRGATMSSTIPLRPARVRILPKKVACGVLRPPKKTEPSR